MIREFPRETGAFGYISVILTVIFSCIFLREQIGIQFVISFACVMGGVYLMMDKVPKEEKKEDAPLPELLDSPEI